MSQIKPTWKKTTCEIFDEISIPQLDHISSTVLYNALHFTDNKSLHMYQVPLEYQLKEKPTRKPFTNSKIGGSFVMMFHFYNRNYFEVQKVIARALKSNNEKTCLFTRAPKLKNTESLFDEIIDINLSPFKTSLSEEHNWACENFSRHIMPNQIHHNSPDHVKKYCEKSFNLALASKNYFLHTFARQRPRLVIIVNHKDLLEAGMFLAAKELNINTLNIPHGFPQASHREFSSTYLTSMSKHHDNYLHTLKNKQTKLLKMGWLEPLTHPPSFSTKLIRPNSFQASKKVLFLSQAVGWDGHRLGELVNNIPPILKQISKYYEVTFRRHPFDKDKALIESLEASCPSGKIKISKSNVTILDDILAHDIIISFSSTGLLYAKYLGKKVLEIRDNKINSVWRSPITGPLTTINLHETSDICDKIDQITLEDPYNFFYNYRSEKVTLQNILLSL